MIKAPSRAALSKAGSGLVLGTFIGMGLTALGFHVLMRMEETLVLVAGLCGALLGLTRARLGLWVVAAIVTLGVLVVAYTPLAGVLVRGLDRRDPLQPASAVVVLSGAVYHNQVVSAEAQARVLQAYAVLHGGYAPTLIVTQPIQSMGGSWLLTVKRQMQALGLDYPVEQTEPISNTHDEALAVARIARERGWRRVILVTQAWHMRRAAAVFEKAGVSVVCYPCMENNYDIGPQPPTGRFRAFRDWLHEVVGYQMYRMRGWI